MYILNMKGQSVMVRLLPILCSNIANRQGLTNDQIPEDLHNILLALLVPSEEVVANASSKHFGAALIVSPQVLVGRAILESVLHAEPVAPERSMVCIDRIIRTPAD